MLKLDGRKLQTIKLLQRWQGVRSIFSASSSRTQISAPARRKVNARITTKRTSLMPVASTLARAKARVRMPKVKAKVEAKEAENADEADTEVADKVRTTGALPSV